MDIWVKLQDIQFNVGAGTVDWTAVVTNDAGLNGFFNGVVPLAGVSNPNNLNGLVGNAARDAFCSAHGITFTAGDKAIVIGFRVERVS